MTDKDLQAAFKRNRLDELPRIIEVLKHNMKVVPDDEAGILQLAIKTAIPELERIPKMELTIRDLQAENARLELQAIEQRNETCDLCNFLERSECARRREELQAENQAQQVRMDGINAYCTLVESGNEEYQKVNAAQAERIEELEKLRSKVEALEEVLAEAGIHYE